jgi:hypothetical protein
MNAAPPSIIQVPQLGQEEKEDDTDEEVDAANTMGAWQPTHNNQLRPTHQSAAMIIANY